MSPKFVENLDKVIEGYAKKRHPKYGFMPSEAHAIANTFYIKHAAMGSEDPVRDADMEMAEWASKLPVINLLGA